MHKKIILITGASSGIGKFLAIELAKKNYEIILSSRSEHRLQETANEIDRLKTPCHIIPADLSDVNSYRSFTINQLILVLLKLWLIMRDLESLIKLKTSQLMTGMIRFL